MSANVAAQEGDRGCYPSTIEFISLNPNSDPFVHGPNGGRFPFGSATPTLAGNRLAVLVDHRLID